MQNRVSVVVPVYNGARYLGETLASALAQTHPPAEVIVVDDGSEDDSAAVAHSFSPQVTLIRQAHAGAGAARNQGAARATGEWLAFLDADDLWIVDKLARQLVAAHNAPRPDMVFAYVEQFISPELDARRQALIECPSMALPGLVPSALFMRRTQFWSIDPFPSNLVLGEFMDWYLRAQETGLSSVVLPNVLVRRRLHRANQGIIHREARADYVHVVKAALDRRRKAGQHHAP